MSEDMSYIGEKIKTLSCVTIAFVYCKHCDNNTVHE